MSGQIVISRFPITLKPFTEDLFTLFSDGEEVGPMVDPNLSRRNFFLYLFTG